MAQIGHSRSSQVLVPFHFSSWIMVPYCSRPELFKRPYKVSVMGMVQVHGWAVSVC